MAESAVEDRIQPAYQEFDREDIAVLARPGEIRLVMTARGGVEQRRAALDRMEARLSELVGRAVFARREEDTLESVVGELLRRRGLTLATAESCTGGLVSARLTAVAGSSDYFVGGGVTYSNRLKEEVLGVPRDLLVAHGAVSEEVARAMAEGARRAFGADLAVAITGVAGPEEGEVLHRKVRFPGDRERVRRHSAQLALEMLRRRLLAQEPEPFTGPERAQG
jgi:nicotinamide-nucleotide amidase